MTQIQQRALVTGGAGSLGLAIAGELRSAAWFVDAPGRQDLDVCDWNSIQSFIGANEYDLLVCNAGISRDSLLPKLSEADWDQTWETNFQGAMSCIRAVLPAMIRRNRGHIVLISSYSAIHPPLGQTTYATAKAALLGLVRDLAPHCGTSNIRINAVLPGFLETKMTEKVSEARKSQVLQDHVLGRFNGCAEVAGFIRFLHDNLPHTSGQVFQLDSRQP
jgi:3-oxoacyl-[acyl-carrier protein] reductase